jgi:hypothetical protein
LRFEAKNGRAIDGRDIYLRDEIDQVTGRPFTVVVRLVAVFGHSRLLEEVGEFWDFPSTIFVVPQVGEEEAAIAVLSIPESCPESSALVDGATRAAGARTVVSAIKQ